MNHPGLEGVVAATTALSEVDGERGELIIGGFALAELAEHASFEETMWLLWHGELPTARQLETFRDELQSQRELMPATQALLRACALSHVSPIDALADRGRDDLDRFRQRGRDRRPMSGDRRRVLATERWR